MSTFQKLGNSSESVKVKSLSRVWLFVTPRAIQSMEFSRAEYWSGYLSLLQGIFPTQGSNPGLLHCRWILYQLSHRWSPGILKCSLSLLQRIFLTQELNWSLLRCRQILYQLSSQGSPVNARKAVNWGVLLSAGWSRKGIPEEALLDLNGKKSPVLFIYFVCAGSCLLRGLFLWWWAEAPL